MFSNLQYTIFAVNFQGDRVFGLTPLGAFAEECIVEQSVSFILFKLSTIIIYSTAAQPTFWITLLIP